MSRNPETFAALTELGARRKFYISTSIKQTNALSALARRAIGYDANMEEVSRAGLVGRAKTIVAAALNGKPQKPEDERAAKAIEMDTAVVREALSIYDGARLAVEKNMVAIARELPAFEWVQDVKGFGEKTFAVIIAEAGDLSNYPRKEHLWKRLGLAPYQGKAMSTWRMKGGLTAEEWTEAGYSPGRLAQVWALLTSNLFKAQSARIDKETGEVKIPAGPYRLLYDARRAHSAAAHPDWSKMNLHMDGMRIMTKQAIRDLHREWNREVRGLSGADLCGSGSTMPPLPERMLEAA